MDTVIFKDNLKRIINRGRFGTRTVGVDILETSLEVVKDYERVKRKLAAIEAISSLEGAATIQTQRN
jgi:hypothetical protein